MQAFTGLAFWKQQDTTHQVLSLSKLIVVTCTLTMLYRKDLSLIRYLIPSAFTFYFLYYQVNPDQPEIPPPPIHRLEKLRQDPDVVERIQSGAREALHRKVIVASDTEKKYGERIVPPPDDADSDHYFGKFTGGAYKFILNPKKLS